MAATCCITTEIVTMNINPLDSIAGTLAAGLLLAVIMIFVIRAMYGG